MKTALLGHFNFKWFMSTVYSPVLILRNQLEGKTLRGSAKTLRILTMQFCVCMCLVVNILALHGRSNSLHNDVPYKLVD